MNNEDRRVDLRRTLIAAGCPKLKADPCAQYVEQAITECLKVYRSSAKRPTKAGVLRRLEKLKKAFQELERGRDGQMALEILRMRPAWSEVSVATMVAEIDRAKVVTGRVMDRRGPPEAAHGRPGFDLLITRVWIAAKAFGFEWTAYKERIEGDARGTFISVMRDIANIWPLPKGFYPASDLAVLKGLERAKARIRRAPR